MAIKNKILFDLGEKRIVLPDLLKEGIVANDRVKYYFTLLQNSKIKILNRKDVTKGLLEERERLKISEVVSDAILENCSLIRENTIYMPGVQRILKEIHKCIKTMLKPLELMEQTERFEEYTSRFSLMQGILLSNYNDIINFEVIDSIVSADRSIKDTPHLLVMDLHKELNNLLSLITLESIDGANVFDIKEQNRFIIQSFMKGINRTAKLKFDHPGLGTTATQIGDKIVIQNDIGETDAHVIVISIEGNIINITYTDIHFNRAIFFQNLLDKFAINWNSAITKENGKFESSIYYIINGSYSAKNKDDLRDFLEFLGSKIVFIIDWNRARKKLQRFISKKRTIELLKWAADNEIGHMAFLVLGGEKIIYEALSTLSTSSNIIKGKLEEILGDENSFEALKTVLSVTSDGLLRNKSQTIIYDEIKADLSKYLKGMEELFIDYISEIACYIYDLASMIRDSLLLVNSPHFIETINKNSEIAKILERDADNVVIRVRKLVEKNQQFTFFSKLAVLVDDVADYLEESAFHLTLLQEKFVVMEAFTYLQELSDNVVYASMELIKIIEILTDIKSKSLRDDLSEFLESIQFIRTIEQKTDVIDRTIKKILISKCNDFKEYLPISEVSYRLERSGDSFMYVAEMLYNYIMSEIIR
jgi:hypothetical protein